MTERKENNKPRLSSLIAMKAGVNYMILFKKKFTESLSEIFDGALSHCECPVCKNKDWFFRNPDLSGLSQVLYEKDEPQKTYTFTCTMCGNIRTHSANIINAALIENDK